MADNPEQNNGESLPPKLDLRKGGLANKPETAPAGIPSPSAGLTSKRETARIPLEAARAAAPAAPPAEPKTIRLKPAAAPAAVSPELSAAAKRTTSRISLDAVLGGTPAPATEGAPKTIRLRRPGEAPALKVAAAAPAPAGAAAEAPPTVRKTVRVKRPGAPGGPPVMSVARPAGAAPAAAEPAALAAPSESVGATAPVFGILGVLAGLLVIWMLCAQVFGPDVSMTPLASGMLRGLDLPWPGKLVVVR